MGMGACNIMTFGPNFHVRCVEPSKTVLKSNHMMIGLFMTLSKDLLPNHDLFKDGFEVLCIILEHCTNYRPDEAENFPVSEISDILTEKRLLSHFESLSPDDIELLYGDMLPEGVASTKEEIMKVLRSSFFKSSNAEFSHTIRTNNVGLILAHSFGYEYLGEGLQNFMNGLREVAKKEKKEREEKEKEKNLDIDIDMDLGID